MPINRFSTVGQSEYTPQHVPLPFEAIGALGAKTQTEYDKSLKDLEVTDPIAKLNPRAAIKVYDPNSPEGVSDAPLDWTGQKNEYLNVLNAEKNKITDDYIQTGDIETFKKKSRDYINKAAQVYSDLSSKEAVAKQVNDFNKELAKNKDFSVQGHLGQKLLDYNTQFFKDAAEGKVREYSPYDIAAPTDRPKEVKEYFGSMGKEILQSFSDPTNTGYIRTRYREGLTGDKISNAFNSWYQNSKVQDDIRLEALDVAARKGIDTKAEVTVKVPVSKNAKTGEITYKEEKMPWIDAYEERALNQVKDMALGFKSSSGKDDLTGDTSYWKGLERQDAKDAQVASTTPEALTLNYQELSKTMPEGLSKFYKDDNLDLAGGWAPGSKEAGDRAAKMGGFLNLDMGDKTGTNIKKNTIEYTNSLFDSASNILGLPKKEIAKLYNNKQDGYSWLKSTVEDYYKNISLRKGTVATLQAPEQETATSFFLGTGVKEGDASTGIGSNIRKSEITDLDGNIKDNYEGINANNYAVSSIGFEKPGQVILSGNAGDQLYMNTNYETFKKITKPVVDIVKGATNFSKTFKLTEDQQQRLGSKTPLKSDLNINGMTVNKTQFDKQQFNIGNNLYNVDAYIIRQNNGLPQEFYYVKEYDPATGKVVENTLTEDQYKVKFSNAVINSPEFRAINKQKENKVSFQ